MGLEVVDETLGKGVVSRITERGVYVTYEATGEHVMYPRGLPSKLLKSAFPEVKKEKKAEPHKGKERTYKVPEAAKPEKKEKSFLTGLRKPTGAIPALFPWAKGPWLFLLSMGKESLWKSAMDE